MEYLVVAGIVERKDSEASITSEASSKAPIMNIAILCTIISCSS